MYYNAFIHIYILKSEAICAVCKKLNVPCRYCQMLLLKLKLRVQNVFAHIQVYLVNKILSISTLIQRYIDLALATICWVLECCCSLLEDGIFTCIPTCSLLFTFKLGELTTILNDILENQNHYKILSLVHTMKY